MTLVKYILADARKRLAVLRPEALVTDAAEILTNPNVPLVVVCDSRGIAVGVISGTDIVKILASARGDAHQLSLGAVMVQPFLSCAVEQSVRGVWDEMNARSVRSVPILDDSGRPQGVIHARDLARALLEEVNDEETLLRNYVLGVGYQ